VKNGLPAFSRRRRPLLLALVCAGFAFALLLGFSPFYLPRPRPDPGVLLGRGFIDARRAKRPERVSLDAEWLVAWGRLVPPEGLSALPAADIEPVRLPVAWNDLTGPGGERRPAKGCATFFIDAALPPGIDSVSIRYMRTAYRLYANGELVASNGSVSEDPRKSEPQWLPVIAPAGRLPERTRFVLQVSNGATVSGGPMKSVVLGRRDSLRASAMVLDFFNAAAFGCSAMMMVYHFLLFFLRTKDRKNLFIAVLCALSCLKILYTEKYLEQAFPRADLFFLSLRLGYLVYFATFPVLVLFVRSRFPRAFPKALAVAASVAGAPFFLVAAVAPAAVYQAAFLPYTAYGASAIVVCACIVARAAYHGERMAAWAAIGFIAIAASAIYDVSHEILQFHGVYGTIYLMPAGFTLFLLIETAAHSLDFMRLSESRKRLAARLAARGDDLRALVDARTGRLKEANRRLLKANADRTAFFAAMSRELRTPLTAIQLALGAVRSGGGNSRYGRDDPVFDVLGRQAARLALQVDGFLAYARLERNGLKPVPRTQNVVERLSYAVAGMRSLAAFHGVALSVAGNPAGGVFADVDPVLFDAALNNALDNAVKLCKPGASVSCSAIVEDGKAVARVACRGADFNPEDEARLFDSLPEADGSGARRTNGVGTGLSLARRIMDSLGGNFEAGKSGDGPFVIVLRVPAARPPEPEADAKGPPAQADGYFSARPAAGPSATEEKEEARAAPRPASSARPSPAGQKRARVLVVDDDDDLLSFLYDGLSQRFDVVCARDGQEALAALERYPDIALIASDVMMPGMDGIELCHRVREGGDRPMPFIFLTARAMEEEMEEALQEGAVGYLVKPFAMDVLVAKAASLIEFSERQREFLRRSIIDHLSGWDSAESGVREAAPRRRSIEDAAKALGLTGRQSEILSLLVKGYTDSEIASYCGISTKTVSDHVRNILEKANVENRTQLAYELLSPGDIEV
jgi:DNA-binding NarL/FixJ family response regulator/signal transduction histidine kinase